MPSFDVVSEVNEVEVRNAVDQVNKELTTRFDFKGSDARVEYAEKEPATGKMTAISPSAWTVQNNITPIMLKPMRRDAGPPWARL